MKYLDEVSPRAEKVILEYEQLKTENEKLKAEFLKERGEKIKAEVEGYVSTLTSSMLFNEDQGAAFSRLLTHAMTEGNVELEVDLRALVAATPKMIRDQR